MYKAMTSEKVTGRTVVNHAIDNRDGSSFNPAISTHSGPIVCSGQLGRCVRAV